MNNTKTKELLGSILSAALENDPSGSLQLKSYVEDGKLEQLFNHPDVKKRQSEIAAEIERLSTTTANSSDDKSVNENTIPIFAKRRNNCFVLINEAAEGGTGSDSEEKFNGVPIKDFYAILTDKDSTIEEKQYAAERLALYHRMKERNGQSTPKDAEQKKMADGVLGTIKWIASNRKITMLDTLAWLGWLGALHGVSYIPFLPNVFLSLFASYKTAQYARSMDAKRASANKQSPNELAASLIGAIVGFYMGPSMTS